MAKEEQERKAKEALQNNFHEMYYGDKQLKLTKKEGANLCGRLDLGRLEKSVKESKEFGLTPFFTVKTHKPEKPFRVIIEDKGTWQRPVAKYLQIHLAKLPVQDPFMIQGSEEVIEFLKTSEPVTCLWVDVKDMYHNIPQGAALATVQDSIDKFGNIRFRNECGTSVSGFLELVRASAVLEQ